MSKKRIGAEKSVYDEGVRDGVEMVYKKLFKNSSYDYSGSRQEYYVSISLAEDDIIPTEECVGLCKKYVKGFKKMFDEIQVENAQREKENNND